MVLLALLGTGLALFSSPNTNAIMSSVEKRHYGTAAAMLSTMRTMGMMMSMAVVMVTFSLYLGPHPIEPPLFPAFLASLRMIFGVFLVLSLAGAALSWRRRVPAPSP